MYRPVVLARFAAVGFAGLAPVWASHRFGSLVSICFLVAVISQVVLVVTVLSAAAAARFTHLVQAHAARGARGPRSATFESRLR
jgi:hypothetical protein